MLPGKPQTTKGVFLSYSHNDRAAASALRAALETAKLSVFKDDVSLRGGDRWLERLQQVLQGCSAFVVLAGRDGVRRWVGAEVEVALIRHLSPEKDEDRLPIFPILLEEALPETLPPLLALFQATRWTPAEALPAGLVDAIGAHTIRLDSPPAIEGCPFVGLNAFTSKDSRLFFGRRRETLEALACLGDQQQANPEGLRAGAGSAYCRWLQIEGNSGTGKSSLVNAGMLPMIEQGALWARTGVEHWSILGPMMPGKDPLTRLAEVVEHGLISDQSRRNLLARQQVFEHNERALAFILRDFKAERSAFLLIVDQFEELFTFADAAASKQFDALLANALHDAECPLFLISTVRADFLDRFERLPRLQAIYNSHCKRYFLPTISEHGLREIIEQPARLAGLKVSEVSTAIIEDARDEIGALPLVENALFTLWQQRQGEVLSGERYRQLKGIAGMLSTEADKLLARIDGQISGGRRGALELLFRLTRINDEGRHTRQRIAREEALMIAGDGKAEVGERVLQLLSGARSADAPAQAPSGALRLITISRENPDDKRQHVDLIHETLIRARGRDEQTGRAVGYWPTLYDYIETNRDRDMLRQQLRFQAERWGKSGVVGRWWNLAGWQDLWRYRRLRVDQGSDEGRFVFRSRWKARAQFLLLTLLFVFVGESFLWTRKHSLPVDYMVLQQRFRLGYAPVPELVPISAGSLDMGEQNKKFVKELDKKDWPYFGVPGIHIEIRHGFSLAKHEVTYEQFDYYVWETHLADESDVAYPTTGKGGRGTRPVVNVKWHEARAYTKWLGKHIKKTCRLPSEAEWEHAARGKQNRSTAYPWGDDIPRSGGDKEGSLAKCGKCSSTGGDDQSAPVGSFSGNSFGLHDTSGNVWEWTCSLWREQFDGNEQRCVVPDERQPMVVRGGSWESGAAYARSAARDDRGPNSAYPSVGFRPLCESSIE
jgi:formylglycine-generating enzyme required for sulfatase activity